MRRIVPKGLLMFGILLTGSQLSAQTLNIRVGGGLGLNLTPEYSYSEYYTEDQNGNVDGREESVGIGLMQGPGTGLVIGYNLNDFVTITGGFDLTFGSAMIEELYESAPDENSVSRSYYLAEITSRVLRGQIGVRIQAPGDQAILPYAGFGLCSMLPSKVSVKNEESDSYSNSQDPGLNYDYTTVEVREFENGISLGGYGVIGAEWKISELLGVFVESRVSVLNWMPGRAEVVRAEENGENVLSDYTTNDKVTVYESSGSRSLMTDDNEPYVSAQEMININALVFRVGVTLTF